MAENLLVRFWMDSYPNAAKTKEAGMPIYDTVPWVEIRVPGERDSVTGPVHRLHPDPRERFPEAWARWQKDNTTEGLTGTPLKNVPWIERGDVETLAYLSVRTVEQLASVTDGNIGKIPGGLALRDKARAMLKAAAEEAPMQRMADELSKRDHEIASLRAQIADIIAEKRKRKE